MSSTIRSPRDIRTIAGQYPVTTYFVLTFAISWAGAFAVVLPHLIRHESLPKMVGILMFPVMLLGPSFTGLFLTRKVDGKRGVQDLFRRLRRWRIYPCWYAALLIAPILVLTVLFFLKTFVSPSFAPNRFLAGILFGVPAGFLEEIGWMGFAFPKLCLQRNALSSSVILGVLWSIWHLPVMDYLGTATPHDAYLPSFFVVFGVAMTAIRVLIAWAYTNTRSVLIAQLMHVSSTGSLVIFSPPRVTAGQEVMWYGIYGITLWIIVAIITMRSIGWGEEADVIPGRRTPAQKPSRYSR